MERVMLSFNTYFRITSLIFQGRALGQRLNILLVAEGAVDRAGNAITATQVKDVSISRINMIKTGPPDNSVYWKSISVISHPKHMLSVLKRTVSRRQFFRAPKTYVKNYG